MTLELLENEMKRSSYFNSPFSVLLIERSSEAAEDREGGFWLTRVRQSLREVDLMGELGEGLYVAILPQTKRRAADALRQNILGALGADAPVTLLTVEIAEPKDLAPVLARRNPLWEAA